MPVSAEKQTELLAILEREKSNFSRFDEFDRQKADAWAEELSMLKRRVENRYELLPLPGGDHIAIRVALTETEEAELADLFVRAFGKADADAPYELIELCTVNPMITAEWLKSHPNEFATQDLLDVLYGYLERKQAIRQEQAERVMRIASFRIKRSGDKSG